MQFPRFWLLPCLLLGLGACEDASVYDEPEIVAVPAKTPAHGPRLSGGGRDPLLLSWMEKDGQGHSLVYAEYQEGSWSTARSVVSGIDMFVNWADMPSVQPMGAGRLVAHWLQRSGEATYAYDVVVTQSLDGGESWSDPVRPHDDGTQTEHGFVSMVPDEAGTRLIWLDGRKTTNERTDNPLDTGMTVRTALINDSSELTNEGLLDDLACDCCQTDMAIAASGPIAVYRDRTPNEIRDIAVTRLVDGEWQEPVRLFDDRWEIPGCPVNGPKVVAAGNFVAIAWFTAAGGEPAVKLAMSSNGGVTFSSITEIERGHVVGQVGLVPLSETEVGVSWMHKESGQSPEVRVQRIDIEGQTGDVHVVTRGLKSRSVPQLGLSGGELVFVWTESRDGSQSIHSARLSIAAL